ncbi:MAG: chorismate mutase [Hyphomicrobiales bacterium]|nr:chorismate mutase [Rickettsiales bacterium]MCP5361215.1 chorismate mutase [Hyphomicrobiales bacterium]
MAPAKKGTQKSSAKAPVTLAACRTAIDAIDDQLVSLLADRQRIVEQVGQLKQKEANGHSIIRPAREARMVRRIVEKTEGIFSANAIALIWRLIIANAINTEEKTAIVSYSPPGEEECYWMAREHFGPFSDNTRTPTRMEVLRAVEEKQATIGVLPLLGTEMAHCWWADLVRENMGTRIFCRLPFVRRDPSSKLPVVAIGHVVPEDSGDDTSLWVITADETLPFETIGDALTNAGVIFEEWEHCRVMAQPVMRYNLLSLPGFVIHSDSLTKALAQVNKANPQPVPVSATCIGAFANPIQTKRSH